MPSDTFAEVVRKLRNHAEAWKISGTEDRDNLVNEEVMAFDCLVAARLLEAAGRENTAAAARIAELEGVLREIAKEEDGGYGFYHGGDPRKFCPDAEGCTPKELADHKAACEKWDEAEAKGEKLEPEPDGSGWISPSVHVTRSAYGMGSYTYPTHAAVLASAALTPPTKEAP